MAAAQPGTVGRGDRRGLGAGTQRIGSGGTRERGQVGGGGRTSVRDEQRRDDEHTERAGDQDRGDAQYIEGRRAFVVGHDVGCSSLETAVAVTAGQCSPWVNGSTDAPGTVTLT